MSRRSPKPLLSYVFFTSIWIALAGCDTGYNDDDGNDDSGGNEVSFEHVGLADRSINWLYEFNNRLFAATDQGLYVMDSAEQWQSSGLDNTEVLDLEFLGNEHFIAAVRENSSATATGSLVESTDGGDTWNTISHNFGGEQAETIYSLHYDRYNNGLYATGVAALAASYDGGRSWRLLNGMWGGFGQPKHVVTHNPGTNEIWYGGQNAIEEMVLVRYSLDTDQETRFPSLLPTPSVIYDIKFSPQGEQQVYVSGEGGVLKTENNGEEWQTLIGDVDHRFYFEIAIDPQDPQTLYTGGWDKNADETQPLIFEMSEDDGQTWTEYRPADDTLNAGVRSVLAREELGETAVYLGLNSNGIVKVSLP